MVFFTCSNCNESLKKNQVDLHCNTRCRRAEYVSCVDCGTDFYGEDYRSHVSCVTEAQKYGGENYVEKPGANKGQKKQEQWMEKVQRVLQTTKIDDPRLQSILESLTTYPNLPQKKAKFLNFVKSTFPRYKHDPALMARVWTVLEEAKVGDASAVGVSKPAEDPVPILGGSEPGTNGGINGEHGGQKKKKQKGGQETENGEPEVASDKKEKKKKKKKRRGEEDEEETMDDAEVAAMREKKWRKRDPAMDDVERLNDTLQEVEKQPRDFNLSRLITEVLDRKGTISLKNLRKKALSEFYECGINSMTEDKVLSKLDKKLRSMNNIQVVNEKVSYADEDD